MYKVDVLFDGYSKSTENGQSANCSCVLITGRKNVIVDTMTCWDGEKILNQLENHKIKPSEIHYVVSTHCHPDHVGNNHLFLNATHIVGFSIHHKDLFIDHAFHENIPYKIDENLIVTPTPGHTLSDISVIVKNVENFGTIVISGDLFEKEEDLKDDNIWISAGSENIELQKKNRLMVLKIADYIVPGIEITLHGMLIRRPFWRKTGSSDIFVCWIRDQWEQGFGQYP